MLQEVPGNVEVDILKQEILRITDIESIHDLHLWSLDGENHILTLHVVLSNECIFDKLPDVKKEIRSIACKHKIDHITIEFEGSYEASKCGYNGKC